MTDELIVYAEAIKEVAKTSGKVVDAVQDLGKFIVPFISGSLEQGMGIVNDKLYYMRLERQVAYIDKVIGKMKARGLEAPTKAVPMKIVIPMLQAASMEDDDSLQDLWANLLVNASDKDSGVEVRRSYISILEELTPLDALIVQKIYLNTFPGNQKIGVWTLPKNILLLDQLPTINTVKPNSEVSLSIENLYRLRLLSSAIRIEEDTISAVNQTVLGRYFYEACSSDKNNK